MPAADAERVITIDVPVIPEEKCEMTTNIATVDLPPTIATMMMQESASNMQASNRNSRGVFDAVMGAIAATVQTNLAEVGTLESEAVQRIKATPMASPAIQTDK